MSKRLAAMVLKVRKKRAGELPVSVAYVSAAESQCGLRAYITPSQENLRACCNCGLYHAKGAFA